LKPHSALRSCIKRMAAEEKAAQDKLEHGQQHSLTHTEPTGDATNALTSMFSDLEKHPETAGHKGSQIGVVLMMTGKLRDPSEARRFIDGFN